MSLSKLFSPSRSAIIAINTFVQLTRMKVFYFLAAFVVLLIAANLIELPNQSFQNPEANDVQVLANIKKWTLGAMSLFSLIFAIVGTALLLPRDVEDRTLYTILAKPVPRLDYLVGKLVGILLLIFVSLLIMDLLMLGMLQYRMNGLITDFSARAAMVNTPLELRELWIEDIREQGPSWLLQASILTIFMKAIVITSVALLLSTFATSTLFTVIMATLIYFVGHFQADAREFWINTQGGGVSQMAKLGSLFVSLIFPDFQLYNVIDATVAGVKITGTAVLKLLGITALYTSIYTVVSWFIFHDKEF